MRRPIETLARRLRGAVDGDWHVLDQIGFPDPPPAG
jgi:hypothetical protein